MSVVRSIFGRSSQLDALQLLVEGSGEGMGQIAVIEGVAGIGKTRLLHEVLTYAEGRGFRVLRGDSDELERERPFRAFAGALELDPRSDDPKRAEIGHLLAEEVDQRGLGVIRGEAIDLSFRIVDEIADLLEELCIDGPVVLGLEDLHWADPSSIRAVRSLARRLARLPLALLVTLRTAPSRQELDLAVEDLRTRGAAHLVLNPLDEDASVSLAREMLSADLGPNLRARWPAREGARYS